jgi:hypothetical protein
MNIDELIRLAPDISPEKLAFLKAFADMPTGSTSKEMMGQLSKCQQEARQKNIRFTSDEQELLIQVLTANLSPAERARVEPILHMLRSRK